MALSLHKILGGREEICIAFVSHLLHKCSCRSVPDLWHFRNSGRQDSDYSPFVTDYPTDFGNLHLSVILV